MHRLSQRWNSGQRVGIEAAKAEGVYKGRPVTLDHPRILAMRAEGKGATEIAKALGCSRVPYSRS